MKPSGARKSETKSAKSIPAEAREGQSFQRATVENNKFQGHVAGLEQIAKNTHLNLKEMTNQFEELCQRVAPERIVPMGIIADVRQTYREIQDQLTKIKGVNQLLEGKYRQYYRRDPVRDREIVEFAYLTKSLYSKFECILQENEAKRKSKYTEAPVDLHRERVPSWFHARENQIVLLRTLEHLYNLDYSNRSETEFVRKREVVWDGNRSISLFILSGEAVLIDRLQPRIRLREYDIEERFARDEIRGALTHLREIPSSEVERVMRRFMDIDESSKLKCLLLSVRSNVDLQEDTLDTAENVLQLMKNGEVKTLPVRTDLAHER